MFGYLVIFCREMRRLRPPRPQRDTLAAAGAQAERIFPATLSGASAYRDFHPSRRRSQHEETTHSSLHLITLSQILLHVTSDLVGRLWTFGK